MAVVTVKSTQITNRDASPRVFTGSYLSGARVHTKSDVVTITSGNSVASIYPFVSIPSNARVVSVRVSAPDIGTTTTGHIGLYKTTADGGAVVDADFFKASQTLKDGAISKLEVLYGNVVTVANANKRIWEHLNLTTDPNIDYDICLTLDGAADGSGAVQLEVDYVV